MTKHFSTGKWAMLCIGAGALRFLDLCFASDLETGFPIVGGGWLRYLLLGILVGAIFITSRNSFPDDLQKTEAYPFAAYAAFAAAVCSAAVAGAVLAGRTVLPINPVLARPLQTAIFAVLSALWLGAVGIELLQRKTDSNSLTIGLGIAGTLYYLIQTFAFLLGNAANLQRVGVVWEGLSYLSALWLMLQLLRLYYLPENTDLSRACSAGIISFLLCACLQLPQAILWVATGWRAPITLLGALLLGMIGLLGLGLAFGVSKEN